MKENEFILLRNSNQKEVFIKKIPTNILAKLKFIKFEHYTLIQRN